MTCTHTGFSTKWNHSLDFPSKIMATYIVVNDLPVKPCVTWFTYTLRVHTGALERDLGASKKEGEETKGKRAMQMWKPMMMLMLMVMMMAKWNLWIQTSSCLWTAWRRGVFSQVAWTMNNFRTPVGIWLSSLQSSSMITVPLGTIGDPAMHVHWCLLRGWENQGAGWYWWEDAHRLHLRVWGDLLTPEWHTNQKAQASQTSRALRIRPAAWREHSSR